MTRWEKMIVLGSLLASLAICWVLLQTVLIGEPYCDTAHYRRMEEKYNGFLGMKAEEVVPLVTRRGNYLILEPHTAENGGNQGIFCFPLTNGRSNEECFIYAFAFDEDHILVKKYDSFWSPEKFFSMLEGYRHRYPD